jgi:hypothetical protein
LWGARLQLPLFVLGAPLIALTLWRVLRPNAARAAAGFVLVASLPWIVFNESRPLLLRPRRVMMREIDSRTVFDTSRRDLYFRNRPELAAQYQAAAARIESTSCRDVGLVFGDDDWEYPFWVLLNTQGTGSVRLSHFISYNRIETPAQLPGYCAVIVTEGAGGDAGTSPDARSSAHVRALIALRRLYETEWTMGEGVTVFVHRGAS